MSNQSENDRLPNIEILYSATKNGEKKRITPKRATENWLRENAPALLEEILDYTKEELAVSINFKIKMIEKGLSSIPFCIECNSEKVKNLNLKYCSNSCAIKSSKTQTKTASTCKERYGKRFNYDRKKKYDLGGHHTQKNLKNLEDLKNIDFMNSIIDTGWIEVSKHFGLTSKSHSSTYNFLRANGFEPKLVSGFSWQEKQMGNFIQSELGIEIETNTKKIIAPYELDIFVPERQVAIEYNGLFYHSYDKKETTDEKNYHKMKTEMCEQKGIQLLHIFEHEWLQNTNKIKSLIRVKLSKTEISYNARDCVVVNLDTNTYKDFCDKNHIQGYCQAKIKIGLLHKKLNIIVAVMSFSAPRFQIEKENTAEIIRFCGLLNSNIRGGFSKLLQYFEDNFSVKNIISFGNRRWCTINNNVYEKNGFCLEKSVGPNYFYFDKDYNVFSRNSFQKHKLKSKLKIFNEELTESELMFLNGYRRFWDSGSLKYRKDIIK